MDFSLLGVGLVLFIGMFSQWLSWRWSLPAIVVMTIAGVVVGPGLHVVQPENIFGPIMKSLISMAVAIILFEGSLSLDRDEIRHFRRPVRRMVTSVPFLSWILTAVATHYIIDLSWVVSFVIGGLFVVTGPTVIGPLLRQSKLKERPASLLHWEGVIVDPVGPLLALLALQLGLSVTGITEWTYLALFFLAAATALISGYFIGYGMGYVFQKEIIPHHMQTSIMFVVVVLSFSLSNLLMPESGLLAVTAMGFAMANMGLDDHILENIRHFKEDIAILLVSAVFVILTATITREELAGMLDFRLLGFVLLMLFIVRPLSVWLSLIGTDLPAREKTLISWIAPRGIVALTVSSYFESILVKNGFDDAVLLLPMTLALVFTTVTAHGFTLSPLAKRLQLTKES
ncbi:sodium:proton antiporter [Salibacterium salarium]|uniref:Sodium:proton antiporter n=1 Tax=Salibacterium salarium TaxID=284579 RepID=A0A3R9QHJ1_9BACI|nr:sodium:proton antiporter [Salibacterium salarium]RSL30571.1 sodium:proton antiporter [Salibacterium salarium]